MDFYRESKCTQLCWCHLLLYQIKFQILKNIWKLIKMLLSPDLIRTIWLLLLKFHSIIIIKDRKYNTIIDIKIVQKSIKSQSQINQVLNWKCKSIFVQISANFNYCPLTLQLSSSTSLSKIEYIPKHSFYTMITNRKLWKYIGLKCAVQKPVKL